MKVSSTSSPSTVPESGTCTARRSSGSTTRGSRPGCRTRPPRRTVRASVGIVVSPNATSTSSVSPRSTTGCPSWTRSTWTLFTSPANAGSVPHPTSISRWPSFRDSCAKAGAAESSTNAPTRAAADSGRFDRSHMMNLRRSGTACEPCARMSSTRGRQEEGGARTLPAVANSGDVGSPRRDRQGEHHADAGERGADRDDGREPGGRPARTATGSPAATIATTTCTAIPVTRMWSCARPPSGARDTRRSSTSCAANAHVWATTRTVASRPNRSVRSSVLGERADHDRGHPGDHAASGRPGRARAGTRGPCAAGRTRADGGRGSRSGRRARARAPARPRPCRRSGSLGAWVLHARRTISSVRLGWIVR